MHFILGYNFQYINRYNIIIAVEKLQYLQTVNNKSFFGWLGFPHTNHSTICYRIVSYLINVSTTLSLQSKRKNEICLNMFIRLENIATIYRFQKSIFAYLHILNPFIITYFFFFFALLKTSFSRSCHFD